MTNVHPQHSHEEDLIRAKALIGRNLLTLSEDRV